MTIDRRLFLKSSCGIAVAVAASQSLISHLLSDSNALANVIQHTIKSRFPNMDFSGTALDEFTQMMVKKDAESLGSSSNSMATIMDDNTPTVSFERYVVREFMLNTNYLSHRATHFPGLQFSPFTEEKVAV